jgi:GNAT superfamily N-acetyltransferase
MPEHPGSEGAPRPVDPGPAASVSLREAVEADVEALAALHARTWRQAYTHLLSQAFLEGVTTDRRRLLERPRPGGRTIVADTGAGLVGFAASAPAEDGPRRLELWAIYLLQDWHGTGVAQRLWDEAVGDHPCFLWVAEDNPRAHAFYARNGMRPDGQRDVVTEWEGMTIVRLVR